MKNKKPAIMICVIGAALLIRFVFPGNAIEGDFEKRDIPTVDGDYRLLGKESGSFFAAWYFAAFIMDEIDFNYYRHKIELDAGKGLLIGSEVMVVEDNLSDQEYDRYWEKGIRVQHKRKLNGKYIDWWKTDQVESGWVYAKRLPDVCGYWVMFDQTQGIVKELYMYIGITAN